MAPDASTFWSFFENGREAIEDCISNKQLRLAFDKVESWLQHSGFDVAFELTGVQGDYWLIFSPEGDCREATIIDELIDKHPRMKGWTILGRKPRKPMPDPLVFVEQIWGVRLDDSRFRISLHGRGIFIEVYSHALGNFDSRASHDCVSTFLFHLLGEEKVMEYVEKIVVRKEPPPHEALPPETFVDRFDEVVSKHHL